MASSKGNVSDLLNKHAQELSDAKGKGKGERDRIKRDFLERLRETINEFIQRGERPSVGKGRTDAERGFFEKAERVEAKESKAEKPSL